MKRLILFAVLLLGAVSFVAAQTEFEPIAPGDTVEGTLTNDAPRGLYTFEGTAGTDIVLTLTSSDFDAYLALQASDNTVLVEDDDSAGQLNSQIVYTLEQDDTYTVVATSLRAYRYNNELVSTGDYQLSFETDVAIAEEVEVTEEPETEIEEPTDSIEETLQTPVTETITFDTVVEGTLDAETTPVIAYSFEVEEAQDVSISLDSDDFDAYLVVRDTNGEVLARDDDGGDETNAFIYGVSLPEAGTYVIEAKSFGFIVGIEPGSGDFTLNLVRGAGMVEMPDEDPDNGGEDIEEDNGDIAYGDVVEARLTNDDPVREYTFDAEAGDIITVVMTSDSLDSYLQLYDMYDFEILWDDDGAGDLNSRMGPFEIAETGTYTIVANSYSYYYGDGLETGNFVLRLDTVEAEVLELNQTVESTLDIDTPSFVYRVDGEEGNVINIELETDSYSAYVRLSGANGLVDAQTYGGPDTLGPIVLPEDAGYILTINSYDLYEPMPFVMTINAVEPQAVTYGEATTANFDNGAMVYTFEGSYADVLDITVEGTNGLDTQLRLTTPSGEIYASDDDSGAGVNPEIIGMALPEDGIYSLLVQPYIPGDNGEFTLLVSNSGDSTLTEEPQIIRVSDKYYQGVATFEAVAGETVQIGIRVLTGNNAEPYVIISQDGGTIAETPIGNVSRTILEVIVPEDGLVQVVVEDYYYEGAVVELTLSRVETAETE